METIPGKERKEWRNLLTDQLDVKLENYVLQMQVNQAKRAIKNSEMSLEEGINKIHDLCEKYALAVKSDMETLFNQ